MASQSHPPQHNCQSDREAHKQERLCGRKSAVLENNAEVQPSARNFLQGNILWRQEDQVVDVPQHGDEEEKDVRYARGLDTGVRHHVKLGVGCAWWQCLHRLEEQSRQAKVVRARKAPCTASALGARAQAVRCLANGGILVHLPHR